MRKTKIGVMDFHGSVDITDPCYDKDVWCRMNNVKISEGEYACYVWRHTDKGRYEDGTPISSMSFWRGISPFRYIPIAPTSKYEYGVPSSYLPLSV